MTVADAKATFDRAEAFKPEPPRPLVRDTPPGSDFPVEALGPILKPMACAIHDLVRAPLAVGAQSVLAAASLIAQAHADVRLPIGQTRPLSQFFVTRGIVR